MKCIYLTMGMFLGQFYFIFVRDSFLANFIDHSLSIQFLLRCLD